MSLKCPHCGLFSPAEAARCDCGYDFKTKTVERSYLVDHLVQKHGTERFVENASFGALKTGRALLVIAAALSVVTWVATGRPALALGPIVAGCIYLARSAHQRGAARELT